uniref:Uncharacterized protein n=1 Tax=Helianthus annuus TaxID=4232 RepID=A0A251TVJ8_HELAN
MMLNGKKRHWLPFPLSSPSLLNNKPYFISQHQHLHRPPHPCPHHLRLPPPSSSLSSPPPPSAASSLSSPPPPPAAFLLHLLTTSASRRPQPSPHRRLPNCTQNGFVFLYVGSGC